MNHKILAICPVCKATVSVVRHGGTVEVFARHKTRVDHYLTWDCAGQWKPAAEGIAAWIEQRLPQLQVTISEEANDLEEMQKRYENQVNARKALTVEAQKECDFLLKRKARVSK